MHVLLVVHEATLTGAPRVALQVAVALRGARHEVVGLLRWHGPIERELLKVATSVVLEPLRHLRAPPRAVWLRAPASPTSSNNSSRCWRCCVRRRTSSTSTASSRRATYVLRSFWAGGSSSTSTRSSHSPAPRCVATAWTRTTHRSRWSHAPRRRGRTSPASPVSTSDGSPSRSPRSTWAGSSTSASRRRRCGCRSTTASSWWAHAVSPTPARASICGSTWRSGSRALPDLPPIRFVWIGARASEARELARARGLDGIVDFCGELDNPYALIRQMDVFTLPSRADAYPLVVLEAMALGRPVVAFDVGGVAEQLGDAGILVPPENVRAFSEGVAGLLKARTKRVMLGAAAQERARQRLDPHRFEKTVVRLVDGSV